MTRIEPFAAITAPELASRRLTVTLKATASSASPCASVIRVSVLFVRLAGPGFTTAMTADSRPPVAARRSWGGAGLAQMHARSPPPNGSAELPPPLPRVSGLSS